MLRERETEREELKRGGGGGRITGKVDYKGMKQEKYRINYSKMMSLRGMMPGWKPGENLIRDGTGKFLKVAVDEIPNGSFLNWGSFLKMFSECCECSPSRRTAFSLLYSCLALFFLHLFLLDIGRTAGCDFGAGRETGFDTVR